MDLDYDNESNCRYLYVIYFLLITCSVILPMKPASGSELNIEPIWSEPESNLRIGLVIKNIASGSINLQLCFSNTASTRQRIYFIENSFFRSFQSYFTATDKDCNTIMLTPPSPPHGYVVSSKDFPLLESETTLCFAETLQLAKLDTKAMRHLSWVYRNEIHRWQGGVSTFDGQTQYLFDENENPELWVGEREIKVPLAE